MIVVSDTTPLNYLILIGQIDVLPKLFSEIRIPPAVLSELQDPRAPRPVLQWATTIPSWLKVATPSALIPATQTLDAGESEAISLAANIRADAILID